MIQNKVMNKFFYKYNIFKLIVVCILLSLVVLSLSNAISNNIVARASTPNITIVIDAGHGGIDGGVVGKTTKVKESDLNLLVSQKLQKFLTDDGYTVVMTRETEDGLYGSLKRGRKMRDLRARENIINQARPTLVVSIHHNSFSRSPERGAQVFYSIGCTQSNSPSQLIARNIQATLNSSLPESDRVAKKGDFYIINCTEFASVLVECGFLSTPEEEALLITDEYQTQIAKALVNGIQQSFGKI